MKHKPRMLDLYSCEGGACRGYQLAGWEVWGIDKIARFARRYPGHFIHADALEFAAEMGHAFQAVHASPPCHRYSITNASRQFDYPDLVGPTREVLEYLGLPWVMENVMRAPMDPRIILCGSMFGLSATDTDGVPLRLERHRQFESNVQLVAPGPCLHDRSVAVGGAYQGARSRRGRSAQEHRDDARLQRHGGYVPPKEVQEELLGIDWMTTFGLAQSLPPVYTQWVGLQLLREVA